MQWQLERGNGLDLKPMYKWSQQNSKAFVWYIKDLKSWEDAFFWGSFISIKKYIVLKFKYIQVNLSKYNFLFRICQADIFRKIHVWIVKKILK